MPQSSIDHQGRSYLLLVVIQRRFCAFFGFVDCCNFSLQIENKVTNFVPLFLLQVTSVKFVGEGDLVVTGSADKVIHAHFECVLISCLKLFPLLYLLPPCYACAFLFPNLFCIQQIGIGRNPSFYLLLHIKSLVKVLKNMIV